ncbi:hypothetical protein TrRE_jg5809 [Triparma retinervis]|uniref:CMP/dCMP-type deaminase domain-containing protein n=1 Tax=Triparma retinervis TaxID=2557542 RepID=A0A9W7DVB7_9STRA|nr:hypothetical protein TrRE_jg5809 [Triparma retinervis]
MPNSSSSALTISAVSAVAAFGAALLTAKAVKRSRSGSIQWDIPEWAKTSYGVDDSKRYVSDEEMMAVAVELSRRNVEEGTGGPFGSAIFERLKDNTCRLVSVGCNRVVPMKNSGLHGETVAIQIAQDKLGLYSLRSEGGNYELFTSCEPCCMCLGATLWSGVNRIVCAARKEDASAIGFDEGPVFEESYEHLEKSGVKVVRNVLRDEAAQILSNYGRIGEIYNR